MKLQPLRGAKFGAGTAVSFAVVAPINNLLRHEPIDWSSVLTGSIFAFFFFGLIGTFTDKLGSSVGDA